MADRLTWMRAVLAACRVHMDLGHRGMWRECEHPTCREAQQWIGPAPAGLDAGALDVSATFSGRRLDRLDEPEERRLVGLPRGGVA